MSHELRRLFGDSGDVGTGPTTWHGGDAYQSRKVHRCDSHNINYSVEYDECPRCREERVAAREQVITLQIRGDITHRRALAGHCRHCGERVTFRSSGSGRQQLYCDVACTSAAARRRRK